MSVTLLPPDSFALFADTAEKVRATTKRLEKAALLGDYFRTLADTDLALAARYFSGYVFSLRDQRTINVGGAALIAAIIAASGALETTVRTRLVALGDAGDVVAELFAERELPVSETLHLTDVASFLEKLSLLRGSRQKVEAITTALAGLTATQAKYFVKLLQGDLRIGLKEGAVEDALARLSETTVAAVQRANMLTGDIGETALLARRKTLDSAAMHLLHPLKFMLATPAADLADVARQMPTTGFVVEDKFDGIRAQVHISPTADDADSKRSLLHGTVVDGRRVALFSRTLDEITGSFPDLLPSLAALIPNLPGHGLILDGEILPVAPLAETNSAPTEILSFQRLQPRLGRKAISPDLLAQTPAAFVAYDLLFVGEKILLEEPFHVRRTILESLPVDGQTVRRADSHLFTEIALLDEEFNAARRRGNEGLMVKDPASVYKPGRRGREWLKMILPGASSGVSIGFQRPESRRRFIRILTDA